MEREINMNEVSDGRLYTANDLVKADCRGCAGCSACCKGMGSSITLDPLDVFRLCEAAGCGFEALLDTRMELNIVDGMRTEISGIFCRCMNVRRKRPR